MKKPCPFCNKNTSDILEHIRFSHDISSVEEFNEKLAKLESRKVQQQAYGDYVLELQAKEKKGEISAEDYRRLITEWINQHKT